MRRNMDLLRALLLAVEGNDDPYALVNPRIEGHGEPEICHHIALLDDAGLITARDRSAIGIYFWSAGQLTWAGHEFLDLVRDDAVWAAVKRRVGAVAAGGLAFEILAEEARRELRRRIDDGAR